MALAKSLAVLLIWVAALAFVGSAQDFGELAPAPAPSMDKGASYSLGMSGALICCSLFFSMLALFNH